METQSSTTDEDILAILALIISTGLFGAVAVLIGGFFSPVTVWALEKGILLQGAGVDLALPWEESLGLDWGRGLIACGTLALGLLGIIFGMVRRHRKRTMVD